MKRSLPIVFAVCFALLSCAKQEPQVSDGDGGDKMGDGLDCITAVGPGTSVKTTTIDGVKVLWTSGDMIGMYAEGPSTAVYTTDHDEPSAEAIFGRTSDTRPVMINERYHAVYPSSAINRWGKVADEGTPVCYVNVPKQQIATVGSWDKNAAVLVAASDNEQFAFRHAVAYLRFEVTDQTSDFVSVRLTTPDKQKLSDPQAGVRYQAADEVTLMPSSSATNFVTLLNDSGGTGFEAGAYYLTFMPGNFTGGLTLTFSNAEGLVAERTLAPQTLEPGEVADCGPVGALTFVEGQTQLEMTTVFLENGVKQGVVYWVDPDNPYKGKVVSASSAEAMDWSEGTIWTEKIISQEDGLANYNQFNSSEVYTGQKDKFHALKYCEDLRKTLGGNWYLPAPVEMRTLFQVYYGLPEIPSTNGAEYRFEAGTLNSEVMAAKAEFDMALGLLGETVTATLDGDADADGISDDNGYGTGNGVTYWTSKVNTGGAVQYVNIGVYNLNNTSKVATKAYVRCIRDVELNGDAGENPEPEPEPEPEPQPGDGVSSGIDPLDPFDFFI